MASRLLFFLLWMVSGSSTVFVKKFFDDTEGRYYCNPQLPYKVYGDGLRHAVAGQPTQFFLQLLEPRDPARLIIWGTNGQHIFNGEAIIDLSKGRGNVTYTVTYTSDYPGEYTLYVQEFWSRSPLPGCKDHQHADLPGSPFQLSVGGRGPTPNDLQALPSCFGPKGWVGGSGWLDGGWISATQAGSRTPTLKDGWLYQPRQCSFPVFTQPDLHELAAQDEKPIWIVIAGHSIQRGIFLHLVDLFVVPSQRKGIAESIIWKCWGWADVTIGRFRFTYIDWRVVSASFIKAMICHNETVVTLDGKLMMDSALGVFDTLFAPGHAWPSLLVLSLTMGFDQMHVEILKKTMQRIPKEWTGTVMPLPMDKVPMLEGHDRLYRGYREQKVEFLQAQQDLMAVDPRVHVYFNYPAAAGMLIDFEDPGKYTSHHLHRYCSQADSLGGQKALCGMEREMVAQILLGVVVEKPKHYRNTTDTGFLQIRVCYDCPASLVPLHIKSSPKLQCYETPFDAFQYTVLPQQIPQVMGSGHHVVCPAKCMSQPPNSTMLVHSGKIVEIRYCDPS